MWAHTLERVGEMKSQKIQKFGLFDSVDEKGVLVKSMEQGWGFRSYTPNIEEKKEFIYHTMFLLFAKAMQHLGLTSQNVLISVSAISYSSFILLCSDKILTWSWC